MSTTPNQVRKEFRQRLDQPSPVLAPGAFNALSARMIEDAGFECVYASGAGIANNLLGYADMGLQTMTDILNTVREMVGVVSIPVIADVDTGFGNVLNVCRTISEFERAGVTGVHLEDQVMPKRCGHFEGKELVSQEEMVQKVRAAVSTKVDPNFLIIARTDARAVEGFERSVKRAQAYAEAGADVIFVDALESVEELESLPQRVSLPQLADMTEGGKTPLLPLEDLGRLGYQIIIYPNALSRACMKSMREMLDILKQHGTTKDHQHLMVTWEERQKIVRLAELQKKKEMFKVKHESGGEV